jgi:hypothetical protein
MNHCGSGVSRWRLWRCWQISFILHKKYLEYSNTEVQLPSNELKLLNPFLLHFLGVCSHCFPCRYPDETIDKPYRDFALAVDPGIIENYVISLIECDNKKTTTSLQEMDVL